MGYINQNYWIDSFIFSMSCWGRYPCTNALCLNFMFASIMSILLLIESKSKNSSTRSITEILSFLNLPKNPPYLLNKDIKCSMSSIENFFKRFNFLLGKIRLDLLVNLIDNGFCLIHLLDALTCNMNERYPPILWIRLA